MKKINDRQKILRAIEEAGFRLVKSELNSKYSLVSNKELLYPFERKVK